MYFYTINLSLLLANEAIQLRYILIFAIHTTIVVRTHASYSKISNINTDFE